MIVVFGSLNVDTSYRLAAIPVAGQTVEAQGVAVQPGGKGANQAIAAARDGATVVMAGAVGQDQFVGTALEGFEAAGIDISRVARTDAVTGVATILVDQTGANAIVIAPGANLLATADQVEDALLTPETIVLLQREVAPGELAKIILRAKARGARIILNLAPAGEVPDEALRAVDILIVNEDEAEWLAHRIGSASDAVSLHKALGVVVIRTVGSDGAELAGPGGFLHIPAPKVQAVDTSAAGDCFSGVFAASLDRGQSLEAAIRRAVVAASLACTRPGSQNSIPLAADTDRAMAGAG